MAYYAIRLGNVRVHKEWMIRTYVLTCAGFVSVHGCASRFRDSRRIARCRWVNPIAVQGGLQEDRVLHVANSNSEIRYGA